ncbi:arfaptin-2b isoform X1 [Nelusetta ayraudi]|uniref:arfaptin-2b isoform X1 n=1 Tax=Nelusetta ayraudi TaxID=303726 RepID=UPI003F70FA4B
MPFLLPFSLLSFSFSLSPCSSPTFSFASRHSIHFTRAQPSICFHFLKKRIILRFSFVYNLTLKTPKYESRPCTPSRNPAPTADLRMKARRSSVPPSTSFLCHLSSQSNELQGSNMHHSSSSSSMTAEEATRGVAVEKLENMKKWSINTYKCTKQMISERFGRGSRTVDLELEAQIEVLRDTKRKYETVLRLAKALTNHFYNMVQTQHALGDTFADLSQKSPELRDEFGYNAETQKLLCKNGETLLGAINFFVSSINTLVNKTMEDTLMTIKMYENARLEFDAYRSDLEELSLGPRDAVAVARIDAAQQQYQAQKDKYERLRSDVIIKLKFLEENKVKVMHKQLLLFHNAISAYFAGNQQQLEQTLNQFNIKLRPPGADKPSWLEEQ